jgi:hypothetical protein
LAFRRSRLLIGSVQCRRGRQLAGWSRLGITSVSRIVPHPIYGWMCWIAILNPTHETFEEVKSLLSGAYERAVERFSCRMGQRRQI